MILDLSNHIEEIILNPIYVQVDSPSEEETNKNENIQQPKNSGVQQSLLKIRSCEVCARKINLQFQDGAIVCERCLVFFFKYLNNSLNLEKRLTFHNCKHPCTSTKDILKCLDCRLNKCFEVGIDVVLINI